MPKMVRLLTGLTLFFAIPTWASNSSCASLLVRVASSDRMENPDGYIRIKKPMSTEPRRDSVFVKMGGRRIDSETISLPRASTINENLGLKEGQSLIFFVEIDVKSPVALPNQIVGDIPVGKYHDLLSEGYVGMTKPERFDTNVDSFFHDALAHAPGFFILSTRVPQHWSRAIKILREAIYIRDHSNNKNIVAQSEIVIMMITHFFELRSSQLSTADRSGAVLQPWLNEFSKEVDFAERKWQESKGQQNIVIPPRSELRRTWWQRIQGFFSR